ncbi:hypothetical protein SLA2020_224790 [Shorea laevis]
MAAKRLSNEFGADPDEPEDKRMRTTPTFVSVIGEVMKGKYLQNLRSVLEPVLRRVVHEEVERGVQHRLLSFSRSPSLRIQAPEPSTLQLIFSNKLSLPIFTGTKITDMDNNPLQILLVDTRSPLAPVTLPNPVKVDIVVLDGDFPAGDHDGWSREEFESKMVRERTGKRPLLTGELMVTVRDGVASVGDIEFTDNSSWIRSRKFRIGAKVAQGSFPDVRVREAMTEAFVVKDHRGELYKKHHPPMLEDEVWRLEKIGKDGAFHKKLASEGINTVQDFLKLSVVDHTKLRKILGPGMSEKMWEVTIKHARTCDIGNKFYIFRGTTYTIILNPICQLIRAVINNHTYSFREITNINKAYVENLVRQAYANWHVLEEVEGVLNETALLTQGEMVDQYPNNQQLVVRSFQQNGYPTEKIMTDKYTASNADSGRSNWQVINSSYFNTQIENSIQCSMMESSSDDDLTSRRTFINGVPKFVFSTLAKQGESELCISNLGFREVFVFRPWSSPTWLQIE